MFSNVFEWYKVEDVNAKLKAVTEKHDELQASIALCKQDLKATRHYRDKYWQMYQQSEDDRARLSSENEELRKKIETLQSENEVLRKQHETFCSIIAACSHTIAASAPKEDAHAGTQV